jgi:hypothetical protein
MTSYYTEFCFAYPLENEEQVQWALDFVDVLAPSDYPIEGDASSVPAYCKRYVDEFNEFYEDYWFDILVQRQTWGDELAIVLTSDEGGDPEHAAWFIEVLMRQFGHTEPISFGWASTVSRPVVDGYGGGVVTVTPKGSIWHVPSNDAWQARERYTRGFFGYWFYRANVQAREWRSKLSYATRKFRDEQRYTTYA